MMGDLWDQVLQWGRNNLSDWTMNKVYIACAVAGGAALMGQTGLSLFGLGDVDGDIDADTDVDDIDGTDGLNFLSLRAMAGFLTFFGLVGWGGTASHWNPLVTVGAAFGSGASVMLMVAGIMQFFKGMQSQGNVEPAAAVGGSATVYLRIPAERGGKGKITVNLQGRSMQFDAITAGPGLPSGADCRILRMTTEGTFEVGPLD